MKIFFVGIHNKPGKTPLDPSTQSGKMISKIIAELQLSDFVPVIRTNLANMERMPEYSEMQKCGTEWLAIHQPGPEDLIILLGQFVHDTFPKVPQTVVKIGHPASSFYRTAEAQDVYFKRAVNLIEGGIKRLVNNG